MSSSGVPKTGLGKAGQGPTKPLDIPGLRMDRHGQYSVMEPKSCMGWLTKRKEEFSVEEVKYAQYKRYEKMIDDFKVMEADFKRTKLELGLIKCDLKEKTIENKNLLLTNQALKKELEKVIGFLTYLKGNPGNVESEVITLE